MKKWIVTGIAVATALNLRAQAPEMFRYQGRLVDGTNLVNATLPMSFKLYDALSGGNKLYEDSAAVTVVDGLYSTMIGDDTVSGSLTNALTNAAVYLELTANGATLSPRERLVSVPYALNTGSATPAGTVVLSSTYPNEKLEAQGYSLVYDNLETDEWKEIDGAYIPTLGWESEFIAHSNQLWLIDLMQKNLAISSDGKRWFSSTIPSEYPYAEIISHNGLVYFFQTGPERSAASTSNGSWWNTWTNNFDSSIELWAFASFKNSLWAFAKTNTGMELISIVMQSTNGVDWTQTASGSWDASSLHHSMGDGDIVTSAEKIWLIARSQSSTEKMVWHSTDGINWMQSATNFPTDRISSETVFFNNKLWCFSAEEQSCWNSSDDGNSWHLVTTNLPVMNNAMNFNIIAHDNKLWMAGQRSSMMMPTSYDLSWSANGIDWNLSLSTSAEITDFIGTEDKRLWVRDFSAMGQKLYVIGGPKKDNGLYYYRKD